MTNTLNQAQKSKNPKKLCIFITTGGTGGHVFPAQALANVLLDYKVVVLVDKRATKYNQGWNEKINLKTVYSLGLHNKKIWQILKILYFTALGFFQSLYYVIRYRPRAIVSFGSYASLPVVLAGILTKIPIIMHEQNAALGKAHKSLAKFVKIIALSFAETRGIPKNTPTVFTGLPVRKEFLDLAASSNNNIPKDLAIIDKKIITLSILGGSQGAKALSTIIPEAFLSLNATQQSHFSVYHQCRPQDLEQTKALWQTTKVQFVIKPFFTDMATIMQLSDLLISRSGASIMAEIEMLKKFAIYVPFAKAVDNHQYFNALAAKKKNKAAIILEQDFSSNSLSVFLHELLNPGSNLNNQLTLFKENLLSIQQDNCKGGVAQANANDKLMGIIHSIIG
ncbi:UDP-N-acetylglucosamine--N-acetylmuramyl-(pentapeptide) pyrophosphoryl-undecaprenol N-acetylglucosamine transferase [Candidatus Hepatincolaceae symbiont of Richtersius coronifer]